MSFMDAYRKNTVGIPHTPTPWAMEEQWTGIAIKPSEGARLTIAKLHGASLQSVADALFIFDACNAHDELVAALEAATWLMDRASSWDEQHEPITKFAAVRHGDEFRRVLAMARGES